MKKLKARRGKKKKLEPWYIATDLYDLNMAYSLYEKRFWIEEMFRDLKSRFHWCGYKVETERRREMLTFCLMLSYTMVAFLGYQVLKTNRAPLVSSYGKSSITWLGIGFLNHRKASASTLFRQIQRRLERNALKSAESYGNTAGQEWYSCHKVFLPIHPGYVYLVVFLVCFVV